MKIQFLPVLAVVSGVLFFSFKNESSGVYGVFDSQRFHVLNTGGASAGNTGAPGENNCTQCHSGTVQAGAGFNVLEWADGISEYTPGETYTIQLSMTDASSKNGFQLLPLLASNNAAAGTITVTDATRTQLIPGTAGKQYLGHRTAGTPSSMWSFDWTAPATEQGDVIFYVATNKTNTNNGTGGDLIRLSQHVFAGPENSTSLTEYQEIQNSLRIHFDAEKSVLEILFTVENKEPLHINVTGVNGQSVLSKSIGNSYPGENTKTVVIPQNLNSGIYIVNFFIGNKAYSQKIAL